MTARIPTEDSAYEAAERQHQMLLAAPHAAGDVPDRTHSVVDLEHRTVLLRSSTGRTIHAFDFSVSDDGSISMSPRPLDAKRFFGQSP